MIRVLPGLIDLEIAKVSQHLHARVRPLAPTEYAVSTPPTRSAGCATSLPRRTANWPSFAAWWPAPGGHEDDEQRCLDRERAAASAGPEEGRETGRRQGVEHALTKVEDAHLNGTAHDYEGR